MKDQRSENVAMQYASAIRQIGLKYTVCRDLKSKVNAFYSPGDKSVGRGGQISRPERGMSFNHDLFCTQRKPTRKTAPATGALDLCR